MLILARRFSSPHAHTIILVASRRHPTTVVHPNIRSWASTVRAFLVVLDRPSALGDLSRLRAAGVRGYAVHGFGRTGAHGASGLWGRRLERCRLLGELVIGSHVGGVRVEAALVRGEMTSRGRARGRAGQGRRPFAAAGHVCPQHTLDVCSTKRMRYVQLGFGLARAGQVRCA